MWHLENWPLDLKDRCHAPPVPLVPLGRLSRQFAIAAVELRSKLIGIGCRSDGKITDILDAFLALSFHENSGFPGLESGSCTEYLEQKHISQRTNTLGIHAQIPTNATSLITFGRANLE